MNEFDALDKVFETMKCDTLFRDVSINDEYNLQYKQLFLDIDWDTVTPSQINDHGYVIYGLTPGGYCYYLPKVIRLICERPCEFGDIVFFERYLDAKSFNLLHELVYPLNDEQKLQITITLERYFLAIKTMDEEKQHWVMQMVEPYLRDFYKFIKNC